MARKGHSGSGVYSSPADLPLRRTIPTGDGMSEQPATHTNHEGAFKSASS